jgi:alanyl-tRNA synthetase
MCCGTHVSNLSQLQVVKLLSVEKGKKGKTLLYFLVGDRVVRYLQRCYEREQKLTQVLNGGAEDHVDLAAKCVQNLRVTSKALQSVMREIASREAGEVNQAEPQPKFFLKHRCSIS